MLAVTPIMHAFWDTAPNTPEQMSDMISFFKVCLCCLFVGVAQGGAKPFVSSACAGGASKHCGAAGAGKPVSRCKLRGSLTLDPCAARWCRTYP